MKIDFIYLFFFLFYFIFDLWLVEKIFKKLSLKKKSYEFTAISLNEKKNKLVKLIKNAEIAQDKTK